ncbi:hypothetical protein H257_00695 [Aphanomyces astaci]|uniref:EF-hand domain-containing protein n=1 Tax=Aphanomyces astaci TaxID=112090 RepID=W4HE21_APHAT|nr:hypothetical protein H257_00695 [Aphanomyces astaci]ETV89403.1 hypothetical protein H257_00695 [Aphanomyces astaci]KAF0714292.1 hypothetical protein AaE_011613 [Aphanomyces astaci]|eukprot:XP_009821803.1 hypothetical protein H257_00695 [Aphanomyces astaci]
MLTQSIRAVEHKSSLVRTLVARAVRSSAVSAPLKFNGQHLAVRMTALGVLGAACVSTFNVAQCQAAITRTLKAENASGGGSSGKKSDDPVSRLIDQYAGSVGQVSFGGAVGFCAGMAVKSIGKVAAVAIGVVFIGAQMAASAGYIQIDWKKVEKDAIAAVDPNGDGKITPDDFKIWWKKFLALSKHNLPSSGGFAAGFFLGLTYA